MNEVFEWQTAPEGDFAVIGDPVSHSLSPKMHAAAYAALGLSYRYRAIHVVAGEVPQALDRLAIMGYKGVNVTVPHKEEVLSWAVEVDPFATRVRAANTLNLQTKSCINTDAPGFLETLRPFALADKRALVLGAGGSSRAIVTAMVEDGWDVRLWNRTHQKAVELAALAGCEVSAEADPSGCSLIVNTTSASLHQQDLPVLWESVEASGVACDLMYSKEPTRFMVTAAAHGLQTVDGLPLLVAQGALAFEYWLGIDAPREAMMAALR